MSNKIKLSVLHRSEYPWQYIDSESVLNLKVYITGKIVEAIYCLACDPCDTRKGCCGEDVPNLEKYEMKRYIEDSKSMYYELRLPMKTHKLRYHFLIKTKKDNFLYDETGFSVVKDDIYIHPFFVSYTYIKEYAKTPKWCKGTVWYQIFPDRYENLDKGSKYWISTEIKDKDLVCGGMLQGISSKVQHLKKQGISGIYLNPIYEAQSIHRYDIIDYQSVDPLLGTEKEFIELCNKCHQNGMKIMMDGVYNHCSYKLKQFQDVRYLGRKSKYYDWFIVHDETRLMKLSDDEINNLDFRKEPLYETFAFVPSMPKWNTENPEVIEYLIDSAEYWTEKCGIDAWRLDVPDEVNENFLLEFYKRMKLLNRDIYIIGEIWSNPNKWLGNNMFDGVMNYSLYFIIRDFIAREYITADEFVELLMKIYFSYPIDTRVGMFNFCSTHDTPRMLWHCGENQNKLQLCYVLTAAIGQQLSIYYGDEVGMTGGYDPDNRRCFPKNISDGRDILKEAKEILSLFHDSKIETIRAIDSNVVWIQYDMGYVVINRSGEEKKILDGTVILPYSFYSSITNKV